MVVQVRCSAGACRVVLDRCFDPISIRLSFRFVPALAQFLYKSVWFGLVWLKIKAHLLFITKRHHAHAHKSDKE